MRFVLATVLCVLTAAACFADDKPAEPKKEQKISAKPGESKDITIPDKHMVQLPPIAVWALQLDEGKLVSVTALSITDEYAEKLLPQLTRMDAKSKQALRSLCEKMLEALAIADKEAAEKKD